MGYTHKYGTDYGSFLLDSSVDKSLTNSYVDEPNEPTGDEPTFSTNKGGGVGT